MVISLLTLVALAVSLIAAARNRPPAWAATLLGVGQPLVAQLIYKRPLDGGGYVAIVVAGAIAGVMLHRAVPALSVGPGPSRWLPWSGQALWGVGLLWVQHAERTSDAHGLRSSLGVFVASGALWAGFAVARHVRPHLREAVVDTLDAARRRAPSLVVQGSAPVGNLAPVGVLPALPYVATTSTSAASAWSPTHVVRPGGLDVRPHPDPSAAVDARLAAGVAVRVVDRRGAWARVDAPNGWSGWVDARLLA